MSESQKYIQENKDERLRLSALVTRLKREELSLRLPNGWTVSDALVHLAFWDLRQAALLRRWFEKGVQPSSLDAEAVNEPLSVVAKAVAPEAVGKLAVEAAETIDGMVEKLTDAQWKELLGMGLERNLRRSIHRKDHLDKIEKALRK